MKTCNCPRNLAAVTNHMCVSVHCILGPTYKLSEFSWSFLAIVPHCGSGQCLPQARGTKTCMDQKVLDICSLHVVVAV